jgi:hypothetical protein
MRAQRCAPQEGERDHSLIFAARADCYEQCRHPSYLMPQEARSLKPQLNDGATTTTIDAGRFGADHSVNRLRADGIANIGKLCAADGWTNPRVCRTPCRLLAPTAMLLSHQSARTVVASIAQRAISMLC